MNIANSIYIGNHHLKKQLHKHTYKEVKMKLVLIRHGQSEWNKLNLFTGWTDDDLTEQGIKEARDGGKLLKADNYDFDICYTSYLKRAIHTLNYVLEELDREWLAVHKTWRLNERHYGALQGLNKADTAKKYGEEQVKIWRRSFDTMPPLLDASDERNPKNQIQYRVHKEDALPLSESLKETIERALPYFEEHIKPDMLDGKRVLIVAHGNSIRALVKHFEKLSNDEIMAINIPTGVPLVYDFDENFNVLNKFYLGDQEALKQKMDSVANQASVK